MALTSNDIKKLKELLATKEDIEPIKNDLDSVKKDLYEVRKGLSSVKSKIEQLETQIDFDNRINRLTFVTHDQFNNGINKLLKANEKFRSDFFTKIDPILKEVQDAREERVLINARLTKLEEAGVQ